jgi:hypothetical protein
LNPPASYSTSVSKIWRVTTTAFASLAFHGSSVPPSPGIATRKVPPVSTPPAGVAIGVATPGAGAI